MKKLIGIWGLLLLSFNVIAQQDTKLTQNMFLIPVYNPGAVGHSDNICASAGIRTQWAGFDGAPDVATFNANAPFKLFGRQHGAGLNIVTDQLGFYDTQFFSAAYSYKAEIGAGLLGVGVNAGLINLGLQPEWIYGGNDESDPSLPPESSLFGFDMGLGAFYSTDKLYFGVSSTHIYSFIQEYEEANVDSRAVLLPHFYAVGGYTIQLPNPMLELMPSFYIQSDGKINHYALNSMVRYNKRFWGGVSYSLGGSASILAGIELMNGVKIGYSYDAELSPMIKYTSGTHEITVRYCFDLSLDKSPQKYESIRFL